MKIGTTLAEYKGAKMVSCGYGCFAIVDASGKDIDTFDNVPDASACMRAVGNGEPWIRDTEPVDAEERMASFPAID